MVLFTVNNMSSPTSSYHITTETPLADASGTLQNASILTLTLPVMFQLAQLQVLQVLLQYKWCYFNE